MPITHPLKPVGFSTRLLALHAGISEQAVRRHLQFIYGTPSTRFIRVIAQIEDLPERVVLESYFNHRAIQRSEAGPKVNVAIDLVRLALPVAGTVPHGILRCYVFPDSVMGFCRLMCINPVNLLGYEKGGGPLPMWLEEAYFDAVGLVGVNLIKGFIK
jgi:hypothetical protein